MNRLSSHLPSVMHTSGGGRVSTIRVYLCTRTMGHTPAQGYAVKGRPGSRTVGLQCTDHVRSTEYGCIISIELTIFCIKHRPEMMKWAPATFLHLCISSALCMHCVASRTTAAQRPHKDCKYNTGTDANPTSLLTCVSTRLPGR